MGKAWIAHRLFSYVTHNWRGRPFVSRQGVANVIGAVPSQGGSSIQAEGDERAYAPGRKLTATRLEGPASELAEFRGEWNYTLRPRSPRHGPSLL